MSDYTILDAKGNPIEHQGETFSTRSRREIAEQIYNTFASTQEAQDISLLLQKIYAKEFASSPESFEISSNDAKFQNGMIEYGATRVIDEALDENLKQAYALMFTFSGLDEAILNTQEKQGENNTEPSIVAEDYIPALNLAFAACPEFGVAQHACHIQTELTSVFNDTSDKLLTTVYANKIQEEFENISDYLNFEQRATGYYRISTMYRALEAEKQNQDAENKAEQDLLKKVLEYSSDYKKINYCLNRIGLDKNFNSMYKAAYKRALHVAQTPQEIYKINSALAQIYLDDYHPQIGFARDLHEEHKLAKAELHYLEALEYAPKPEHLHILKEIGKLQKKQNKIQDWTATQTKLAMEYMQGEDRVMTLMKVAKGNPDLRTEYLEAAISETDKSKQISKGKKSALIQNIATLLRPIYENTHNQAACQKLDAYLKKYVVNSSAETNPLLQYQAKNKNR